MTCSHSVVKMGCSKTHVTRKAKTDLMALTTFDRPFLFNLLVHDDSLLHKFIILYLRCTMMQLPGNQVSSSSSQRWLRSNELKTDRRSKILRVP